MLNYFKEMKCFLAQLELPCDIYIPIIHKSLFLYAERIPGREARNRVLDQSFVLMSSLSHLSKNSQAIDRMAAYCDSQIAFFGRDTSK